MLAVALQVTTFVNALKQTFVRLSQTALQLLAFLQSTSKKQAETSVINNKNKSILNDP
jgi:hypothetical protein